MYQEVLFSAESVVWMENSQMQLYIKYFAKQFQKYIRAEYSTKNTEAAKYFNLCAFKIYERYVIPEAWYLMKTSFNL